jgi:hypothetical protein
MRTIMNLFTEARGRGHVAVFHEFAEGLARALMVKRRPTARVRAVGS